MSEHAFVPAPNTTNAIEKLAAGRVQFATKVNELEETFTQLHSEAQEVLNRAAELRSFWENIYVDQHRLVWACIETLQHFLGEGKTSDLRSRQILKEVKYCLSLVLSHVERQEKNIAEAIAASTANLSRKEQMKADQAKAVTKRAAKASKVS